MKIIASNKKAFHNFFISDLCEAGIVLEGCEVKSIRTGGVSLTESFVVISNNELYLKNAYIKPYENSSVFTPDSRKNRKLLLHKEQIEKFSKKIKEKGFSVVATKIYISRGKVKVEVGLAKGKKLFDKRETLKQKSVNMEIDRAKKNFS